MHICRPDPYADAEVREAHEEHDNVGDEEEILGALLPPVQAVQVIAPHCPVAHPYSHKLSSFFNHTLHLLNSESECSLM